MVNNIDQTKLNELKNKIKNSKKKLVMAIPNQGKSKVQFDL